MRKTKHLQLKINKTSVLCEYVETVENFDRENHFDF